MKGRLFFWFVALLLSTVVRGAVLNVGPGQTYETPVQAAAFAQPGDTVLIHPHVYTGSNSISNLHGDPEHYIYFIGVDPHTVIFQGSFQAMHLSQVSYIHLEGISVTGQIANGINIDDGGTFDTPTHHVRVVSCYFFDMGGTGNNDFLKMSGVDEFLVENCHFENGAGGGSGIDMVGCHHGVIRLCSFKNMGANAIQAKGGTQYISMHQNIFEDAGLRSLNLGGSTDLAFFRPQDAPFEAADLHVYANIFIGSWSPIAYVGCVDVHVWNNTIILPENWVVRILQENVDPDRFLPCGDNSFVNNIIYYSSSISTHVNIGPNTAPESFEFAHNLWYRYDQPSQSTPNLPVAESQGIYGEYPSFVDFEESDYRLNAGSPAIDAGMLGAFPIDFNGLTVPQGAAPDIGAFEFPISLSMELIRFDVNKSEDDIPQLAYTFSLSDEVGKYRIQRSSDGVMWQDLYIDSIQGSAAFMHSFKDRNAPKSLLYYRISYTTPSTADLVSPIRSIDNTLSDSFILYPNPCRDRLYIKGNIAGKSIVIFDTEGRIVHANEVDIKEDKYLSLYIPDLPVGFYVLQIGQDILRFQRID